MLIDLRSDTLTKPTPEMRAAMFAAEIGDDVFKEDPTVNALQAKTAAIFGMEAGLFCPSGTMTNQIAIRVNTQPQDEVICDKRSHIYLYEGGGAMSNSGVSMKLLNGERGILSVNEILENINPDDIHYPHTQLVALENTCNKGGGSYYRLDRIAKISALCKEKGLRLHLDGARVFNALVETGENPTEYGKYFDTISVCLSKGLGAPIGSVLLGSQETIKKALRVRKVFGGGMRQAGFLAAAGIFALENNIERLKEDHRKARMIAETLSEMAVIESIMPADTNIVIFEPKQSWKKVPEVLQLLAENGIKAAPFGHYHIRMVTHLDFSEEMLGELLGRLKKIFI